MRRGLWEHVRDGRMSTTQALAFIYICTQCDTRSGIWKGCAKSLSGELGIPQRTARDVLEKMERDGYIRRFAVRGKHTCYPILVHRFEITEGKHNGEQLDAINSIDANTLRYLPTETREHGVEHSAAQRRIKNGEKRSKKNPAAKATPPADPRFGIFRDSAYEAYRVKHGQPPTWGGKDWASLKRFLADQPQVALEQFQHRFDSYLQSTERFTRNQGGSLAYFIAKFDAFAAGPILDRTFTGGSDGGHESFDERGRRKSAEAISGIRGRFNAVDGEVGGYLPESRRN